MYAASQMQACLDGWRLDAPVGSSVLLCNEQRTCRVWSVLGPLLLPITSFAAALTVRASTPSFARLYILQSTHCLQGIPGTMWITSERAAAVLCLQPGAR